MHTAKSVQYHLATDKSFVLSCLMILNARRAGFLPQDAKQLKMIAAKVKKRQKLMTLDWVEARRRLTGYASLLALAINDIDKNNKKP